MSAKPKWMDKHPCAYCNVGYGECASGWVVGVMCCPDCKHPGWRTTEHPDGGDEHVLMQQMRVEVPA